MRTRKRRDGHEGWSREYAEAWDRVFGKPVPMAGNPPQVEGLVKREQRRA